MHRSGTSLVSHYLHLIGINMGEEFMGRAPGNPRGHFEDMEIFRINQMILEENQLPVFTDNIKRDLRKVNAGLSVSGGLGGTISKHVNDRDSKYEFWGWKDPRTVLTFNVWSKYCPNAYVIVLFRSMEQTVDSLLRRGSDQEVVKSPIIAVRSWILYNKILLDLIRKYDRKKIVVIDIDDFVGNYGKYAGLLEKKLSLRLRPLDLGEIYKTGELKTKISKKTRSLIFHNPGLAKESKLIYDKLMAVSRNN